MSFANFNGVAFAQLLVKVSTLIDPEIIKLPLSKLIQCQGRVWHCEDALPSFFKAMQCCQQGTVLGLISSVLQSSLIQQQLRYLCGRQYCTVQVCPKKLINKVQKRRIKLKRSHHYFYCTIYPKFPLVDPLLVTSQLARVTVDVGFQKGFCGKATICFSPELGSPDGAWNERSSKCR